MQEDKTNDGVMKEVKEEKSESNEPVYFIIESENKYAITSDRKINKVRLHVKRWEIGGNPFMKTSIQIMNQAGTDTVQRLKGGKAGYSFISEVSKTEKDFGQCVKKCKRFSNKALFNRQAKSVDRLLSDNCM